MSIDSTIIVSDSLCPNQFTRTATFIATDSCGNADTLIQVVNVLDTINPTFTLENDTVDIECAVDVPALLSTAVTDNCGIMMIDSSIVVTDSLCPNQFTRTATFIATDSCGNADTLIPVSYTHLTLPTIYSV